MATILVIGASRGIGLAVSTLLQKDCDVISISRSIPANAGRIHYQCDVANEALPVLEQPLTGLVYCPGTITLKPFSALQCQHFRDDLELNLISAIRCLSHYRNNLQASQAASVVLFSSVAATLGLPFHTLVAASKGAVEGLTRSLAAEWAPTVRVNAIAPSITNTNLAKRLLRDDEKIQAAADRHAMKRIGEPDDIAEMVCFLLSEKSSWITGQVFHVDGGISTIQK